MAEEISASNVVIPPSIADHLEALYAGQSYSHYSPVPSGIIPNGHSSSSFPLNDDNDNVNSAGTPCVLGVDEAGRGPVIGPMIYGIFYLPQTLHHHLLAETHHFDDSKVLTPAVRADLMRRVCHPGTDLYNSCGWAIRSLSALDIGAGMLRHGGSYNLNAQAMDATIEIIRGVVEDQHVNVTEVYVDTIGVPSVYQKKLERIFPTLKITVEKKADSLFPCVSAASVVAKVTRDISCEMLYDEYLRQEQEEEGQKEQRERSVVGWGSGYPSDAKCVNWLKGSMHPAFGWGTECRFSWGTVKDMLEVKGSSSGVARTDWPAEDDDDDNMRMSSYFVAGSTGNKTETDELRNWYGTSAGHEVF